MLNNYEKNIYLDYNATAPLRPAANALMNELLGRPLNASAVHGPGREGRKHIEAARQKLADLCGVTPGQVVFNSGATEANNTVLKYFAEKPVLISAIEHPCVLESAPHAARIPVTAGGVVDLQKLEDLLKAEKPALVSVMAVNNESGVIQPLSEISALCKKYGALLHCDAVQAVGRIPIGLTELGADFLSVSSHKIGGPQGVGALVLGLCGMTPVLLHGGGQERQARAGTENVAGIAGFGAALDALGNDKPEQLETWRDKLESGLQQASPETIIHCQDAPRVCNTSFFSLPGVNSETVLMGLDLENIAVSNGSACSSGKVKASHVLKAMGHDDAVAGSAIRVSLGWDTKESDIDAFLQIWSKLYDRIKRRMDKQTA